MIQYMDEQAAWKDMPANHLLVMETNLQGVWELGMARDLRTFFSATYRKYMFMVYSRGKEMLGKVLFNEEVDVKIALIFNEYNKFGKSKDSDADVLERTKKGIIEMLSYMPCDMVIYSPILQRRRKLWKDIEPFLNEKIKNSGHKWIVIRS